MSRKYKNQIDKKQAMEIFVRGYGLEVIVLNDYQFRIRNEENQNVFFDWYHTTGSLVVCRDGYNKGLKKILEPEEVAIFINKYLIN